MDLEGYYYGDCHYSVFCKGKSIGSGTSIKEVAHKAFSRREKLDVIGVVSREDGRRVSFRVDCVAMLIYKFIEYSKPDNEKPFVTAICEPLGWRLVICRWEDFEIKELLLKDLSDTVKRQYDLDLLNTVFENFGDAVVEARKLAQKLGITMCLNK